MNSGKIVLTINFITLILIIILGIYEIRTIERDTISFMENLNDVKNRLKLLIGMMHIKISKF
ncbi:hypothetical protein [Caloramator sp. Dgby_cultured_2]|uniref:hypothetical protein n=1 Tax=Caloramator sp. Dgby_cultured_2 TaxID=3029174 RepID=UPI00237E1809|nr:hypothetical protein [Caloramator sp. Dgby_cultured_2]WDU83761.1 hypothetical protein PWK10_04210 [Caloramator sp. Dgby_cultured_2]